MIKWFGNERKPDRKGLLVAWLSKRGLYELSRKIDAYHTLTKSLREIIALQGITNRERMVSFHMARQIAIQAIKEVEELQAEIDKLIKNQQPNERD